MVDRLIYSEIVYWARRKQICKHKIYKIVCFYSRKNLIQTKERSEKIWKHKILLSSADRPSDFRMAMPKAEEENTKGWRNLRCGDIGIMEKIWWRI